MAQFFIADLHFGHNKIVNFTDATGNKLRQYDTVEDMEDAMVQMHNELVKPTDKVYMLGDIAFNQRGFDKVKQMKVSSSMSAHSNLSPGVTLLKLFSYSVSSQS